MRKFYTAGAAAALAFGMALPAFAQSSMTHTSPTTSPAATSSGTAGPDTAPGRDTTPGTMAAGNGPGTATKGPTGTLHKVHGQWRASSLVGATVYNSSGQEVGTVENLLIRSQGTVSGVVISVGGFLGVGSKYVEVPFSNLHFQPSTGNGAAATGGSGNGTAQRADYSLVLPGSTKASLTKMPAFKYHRNV
ncbi:MAG TPA: PRC-barrel domain-containing protein [Acetobacteraceae bacterium]|nr:PRC-barrel domain-containing protein [Acetobacteraceae bacterium]